MEPTESKPGRPPFKPTKAQRNDVMLYAASGVSERAIAVVLGIARPTLREQFAYELVNGRTVKRAQIHKRLEEAAAGGNFANGWRKCKDCLIDRDDQSNHRHNILALEFLLRDQWRERCQVANAQSEEDAAKGQQYPAIPKDE